MQHGKSFLKALMLVGVVAFVSSAAAETKTWTGTKSTASSVDENWSPSGVPVDGDDIVFGSGATRNCSWTLDIKPASWTQDGYTGTITFATEYPEWTGATLTCVEVTGDVTVNSGTWTHKANSGVNRHYRLYVKAGGNMTIAEGVSVNASKLGYTKVYQTREGTMGGTICGSNGGVGSWISSTVNPLTTGCLPYGNVYAPEDPGSASSSGYSPGGGAIRLDVGGALVFNGTITANATPWGYTTGAGGSVYIRAGSISGTGTVSANSLNTSNNGTQLQNGGVGAGGRIAIVLTGKDADFSKFDPTTQLSAKSVNTYYTPARVYASGTVYVETAADAPNEGWLIIDGGVGVPVPDRRMCNGAAVTGTDGGTVHFSKITLTNGAKAVVPPGVTLDIRGTTFDGTSTETVKYGIYLFGGDVLGSDDCTVGYEIVGAGGTITAKKLTFAEGASFRTEFADGTTFAGGLEIASGATALVDKAFEVTGDFTLGGTLTCTGPSSSTNPVILLDLTVGGDMTVSSTGLIDWTAKGYRGNTLPAGQTTSSNYNRPHGGEGYGLDSSYNKFLNAIQPYGSIREPLLAGAGGAATSNGMSYIGGGRLKLVVGGELANEGTIRANAKDSTDYPGAGGSVNIRAGSISGGGTICANGGFLTGTKQPGCSGGGRVAIRLTGEGADFSQYTGVISAYGSRRNVAAAYVGGAGSVWLRTAAQSDDEGTLIVRNELSTSAGWAGTLVGGAFMEPTDVTFGDVLIGNSAQLKLAADADMYVSGAFSNGCAFVGGDGSTVHFIGEGESRIDGDITFANAACDEPGKTLVFADGATVRATEKLTFKVTDGEMIVLRGEDAESQWTPDNVVGSVTLDGVALSNCQSTAALTVMNGKDLGGNSANITFVTVAGSELLTWTGEEDSDWGNVANWDKGRLPRAVDQVLIPVDPTNSPILRVDTEIDELTVEDGATLNFADKSLKVCGTAAIAGDLVADANTAVLEVTGDLTFGGALDGSLALVFSGTGDQAIALNGQAFRRIDALAPAMDFTGDFSATKIFIGTGTDAFDCAFAADALIATDEFTVRNGTLRCATAGDTWKLKTGNAHVTGVTVSGSDASLGETIFATDSTDGEGNVNWVFGDTRTHWTGSAWTDGEPTAEKGAVVDAGATLPLAADMEMAFLTVDEGATLKVDATLAVDGTVVISDGATVEWNVPGTIGGDLILLSGAKLTHASNADSAVEAFKLDLTIGGDAEVRSGAAITAKGKGYHVASNAKYNKANLGPGGTGMGGGEGLSIQASASYGGRGYTGSQAGGNITMDTAHSVPCYGSILCPTNCGSCGFYYQVGFAGGGAIRLAVEGTLTVDGEISADGAGGGNTCTASGGSVWLTASALVGGGLIHSNGGDSTDGRVSCGGGGRVAVYLTAANDFSGFAGEIAAFGGKVNGDFRGSAGTCYLETAADGAGCGVLSVANYTRSSYRLAEDQTDLPGGLYSIPNETRNLRVEAKSYGTVSLTGDVTIRDISLLDKTARLKLNGHTLTVRSFRHAVSPDDTKQIDYGEGGKIDWLTPGLMILIR